MPWEYQFQEITNSIVYNSKLTAHLHLKKLWNNTDRWHIIMTLNVDLTHAHPCSHHSPKSEGQRRKLWSSIDTFNMEAGFLLEDNKSLVEEHFEAINRRFLQLQQSALDYSFPSNVSGTAVLVCLYITKAVDPTGPLWRITDVPNFLLFGIVKWLLEEADKTLSSNTFLAARILSEAKDVASRVSQMEVSCDQALIDI